MVKTSHLMERLCSDYSVIEKRRSLPPVGADATRLVSDYRDKRWLYKDYLPPDVGIIAEPYLLAK
jgi:hypothetical protein